MKRIAIIYLSLMFTVVIAFGQNLQDVVYLKNGSIIRGTIVEQVPNQSIKIETADRNIFVYQMDEIEKITKENKTTTQSPNVSNLKKGYKGIVEAGYNVGFDFMGIDRAKINFINGYQFNPHFSLGLGVGGRMYYESHMADAIFIIPIFIDARYDILNRRVSPFISMGAGNSFRVSPGSAVEGIYLSPTIGVSYNSKKVRGYIGINYEHQDLDMLDFNNISMYRFTSKSIGITAGLAF